MTQPQGARLAWSSVPLPVRRAVRDGGVIAGLLFTAYLFVIVAPQAGTVGFDAFAYWAVDPADPYETGVGGLGAFNYSPPIARLFGPFGALEWPTFLWLWLALLVGNVIWLGGRGVRVLWLFALPPVALELYHGNIHLWIAAAIALGFRYPWTWGFVLLTKVTPGIGLLWFAVRREWRALGIALGVTARSSRCRSCWRASYGSTGSRSWIHARGRLGRPVPDPHPAVDPPAGGRSARCLGRPDRSALDGAGRRDAGLARAVGQRLRDLCGAGERGALAGACEASGSGHG